MDDNNQNFNIKNVPKVKSDSSTATMLNTLDLNRSNIYVLHVITAVNPFTKIRENDVAGR